MSRSRHLRPTVAATALVAVLAAVAPTLSQAPAPRLALRALRIEPAAVRPETLCHVSLEIENLGTEPVSAFLFDVRVAGIPLLAYRDHRFLSVVPPGEIRTLRLLSFWSDESGRPFPEGDRFDVTLTLREASWMQRREDPEGTVEWSARGPVEGLPLEIRTEIPIER